MTIKHLWVAAAIVLLYTFERVHNGDNIVLSNFCNGDLINLCKDNDVLSSGS